MNFLFKKALHMIKTSLPIAVFCFLNFQILFSQEIKLTGQINDTTLILFYFKNFMIIYLNEIEYYRGCLWFKGLILLIIS